MEQSYRKSENRLIRFSLFPITNAKWNPINNAKRHDKAMAWKVKQMLLHGHSPETIAWHAGNVTATLSSPYILKPRLPST
jgi:hypothetical protein